MVGGGKKANHGKKKTRLGKWVEFKIQKKSIHKEKEKLNQEDDGKLSSNNKKIITNSKRKNIGKGWQVNNNNNNNKR